MMAEITLEELEEIKKADIEILDVIAKFCEERKIKYWIDCGTLIGAIRHKGFIPWDDDIDVGMLRPDYDRFMKEFNDYDPRYKFCCPENTLKWGLAFGKVFNIGTHRGEVDIFFYDNAPDDDDVMRKMFRRRDFLQRMNRMRLCNIFSLVKGNIFRRTLGYAARLILRLFPRYYFLPKLVENSKRYISENTKRVGNFSAWIPAVCDKDVFASFIDVDFEGKKYKAPVGYDKWLRAFYGDYMQLPPVEQRVPRHYRIINLGEISA